MVILKLNNDFVNIENNISKEHVDVINNACSYFVPQAQWSEKYQTNKWDGKISLLNKYKLAFPSGILKIVEKHLIDNHVPYTVLDQRSDPIVASQCILDKEKVKLRDYQLDAVNVFKKEGRGILAMCTGAGKTKTSCAIISECSVFPVLFVVPSVSLMLQTVDEFKSSLIPQDSGFGVGKLGGGEFEIYEKGINVATYHTLLAAYDQKYSDQKKKIIKLEDKTSLPSLKAQLETLQVDLHNSPPRLHKSIKTKISKVNTQIKNKSELIERKKQIRDLLENIQLLFIDETHIAAETIELISLKCKNSYYKCGLSGTPSRQDNQDLRMFGATGEVIKKVSASELIKKGWLVRPHIYIIDIDFIDKSGQNFQETYKNAIVENEQRNQLIKFLAEKTYSENKPTLIMVERLEHGKILESLIKNSLFVPGKDGSDDCPISDEEINYRKKQLMRLENNEIIMIATQWCNQGIDAPKIEAMILAGAVASPTITIQQVGRALRKAENKDSCVIFDFRMEEKQLKKQASSRLKAYKTEPEYKIRNLRYNKDIGSYV